jgi:hypothetical protein
MTHYRVLIGNTVYGFHPAILSPEAVALRCYIRHRRITNLGDEPVTVVLVPGTDKDHRFVREENSSASFFIAHTRHVKEGPIHCVEDF